MPYPIEEGPPTYSEVTGTTTPGLCSTPDESPPPTYIDALSREGVKVSKGGGSITIMSDVEVADTRASADNDIEKGEGKGKEYSSQNLDLG